MKQGLPLIILLVVTALAAGGAFALNSVVGGLVAPDEAVPQPGAAVADAGTPAPAASLRTRLKTIDEYLTILINRNLFNRALHGTFGPRDSEAGEVRTTLDVILLGTVVAEPESFSSALIVEKGEEDWPKGYSIGDELFGHEIVAIEKKRVGLKKPNGTIEWLTLDDSVSRPAPERTTAGTGDDDGSIQEAGDNKYVVDKTLFDKYINDIESISRMGRALLHRGPDGEFDGYRLSAIRRNTLADQLGIKNGDVVHSVNGTGLDSVQSAMNAYQTLQNESSFCFEITRRGQPMELCYDVQ